jgi:protein-S-isoprenylcysteine O-methyltransferase Ste14
MEELFVIIFVCLYASLFFVEAAARKHTRLGQYAWFAHALRPLLFFGGIGALVIFVGTDWDNPFWERIAGIACFLAGAWLFVRATCHRKQIQTDLESGRIGPTFTHG